MSMVFFCLKLISPGSPSAGAQGKMNGRKLSTALLALDGPLSEQREAVYLEEVGSWFLSLRNPWPSAVYLKITTIADIQWVNIYHEHTILHSFFLTLYIFPCKFIQMGSYYSLSFIIYLKKVFEIQHKNHQFFFLNYRRNFWSVWNFDNKILEKITQVIKFWASQVAQ